MEKIWAIGIAILIFLIYNFLFWLLTKSDVNKKYGKKMWKHWPSMLYYWQAAILYSVGLTFITLLLLKWTNILTF